MKPRPKVNGVLKFRRVAADEAATDFRDGEFVRPTKGWEWLSPPPLDTASPSQKKITIGKRDGWISIENERVKYVPSGPPEDPHRHPPHVFIHADAITFHMLSGDYRYRVTHQPDKYEDDTKPTGFRFDWFYVIEREE